MGNDMMKYEFAAIEGMAKDLDRWAHQIDTQLKGDVNKRYDALLNGGWHGESANAFTDAKTRWTKTVATMILTIEDLMKKVHAASQNMADTDRDASKMFK